MKLASVILVTLFSILAYADERPRVKVGAILHITGDLAMTSTAFREGIELAADLLNARTEGPRYDLVIEDGLSSTKVSYTASQKLISMDQVNVAILESFFDLSGDGPLFERSKIPSICLWDSNPEIDSMGQYIFSIGPWTPSSGETASHYALEKLGAKKAVVIYNPDKWSESVKNYFRDDFVKKGGIVLQEIMVNNEEPDFRAVLARAISLKPDFLYAPISFNFIPFYNQLKKYRFTKPVISSDTIDETHILESPEAFEGIYQTGLAKPSSREYQKLSEAYLKKHKKPVGMPWNTSIGYDAMMIIDRAVQAKGTSREQITAGLYTVQNYEGASTTISINDKGTAGQGEVMYRVRGGKLVLVE